MAITLKAARANKGISQKEAADKLGINVSTLHNYENGKTFPSAKVINKMEKLYEVSYNDLIFMPSKFN